MIIKQLYMGFIRLTHIFRCIKLEMIKTININGSTSHQSVGIRKTSIGFFEKV